MKKHILVVLLLATFTVVTVKAQDKFESGVIVKKLFLDYSTLNGGDVFDFQDWNGGWEIGYTGYFNENWSLAIPIKIAEVKLPEATYSSRFIAGEAQLQYHIIGRSRKVNPYVSAGAGYVMENEDDGHAVIPFALGVQIPVGPKTDLNGEFAYRLGLEDDRDNFCIGLGFVQRFGKVEPAEEEEPVKKIIDSDGDGLADDIDLCPQVPGLDKFFGCPDTDGDGIQDDKDDCPEQPGPMEFNGCPDSDGDGLSDKEDECPNRAGPISNNGCPEVKTDRDGDGIADDEDRCPDEPGPAFLQGCPDTDGDGVADIDDACVNTPGPKITFGCPDTDGDGVADKDDRCITVPGPISNLGCPELEEEDRKTLEFAVQAVEFEFGKATLNNASFPILNKVADVMNRYPHYKLRITGHTDNVGDPNRNMDLSERRARSCYEYLSTKGVPVSRMSYSGMGETQPIATNDTDLGRSHNRRVEFDVYLD